MIVRDILTDSRVIENFDLFNDADDTISWLEGRKQQCEALIEQLRFKQITYIASRARKMDINPTKCSHTEHCCILHGCKYNDEDCPVVTGLKRQSFPCEDCHDSIGSLLKVD